MQNMQELLQEIIHIEDSNDVAVAFKKLKREYAKIHKLAELPTNTQLLTVYRDLLKKGDISRNEFLESILKKRGVRSQSGIVPIQVLTKPFWCPGKCIFCPNDATMPKSYINTEPGAMRALLNQFDPYKQTYNRLLSLYLTGHATDKIEMIVLGGTWDVYPNDYKRDFLKGLYDACNTFDVFMQKINVDENARSVRYTLEDLGMEYPATIEESMKINETSDHRIIGLTIETRPEYMTDENCRMRRSRGVTRLEMGLQSMFDDVLDANKRGHSVQQAREAVHKMRQYGFKFSIHFMPGLYGSTVEKDIESFRLAYADPWLKPDEIKFYPTSVIPNTELYELYKKGEYVPLTSESIVHIIKTAEREIIPPYTRIKRLIRDIPETEIVAGSKVTNLRQITEREMLQENREDIELRKRLYNRLYEHPIYVTSADDVVTRLLSADADRPSDTSTTTYILGAQPDNETFRHYVALDTRAREMRHRTEGKPQFVHLIARHYRSSVGQEFFLSFEDELGYIYGFTRLLLPDDDKTVQRDGLGESTAMIRELHVYGQLAIIKTDQAVSNDMLLPTHEGSGLYDKNVSKTAQHKGFGTQLMETAEKIAAGLGYDRLSVISGIGVREYYKKLGYSLDGTYMVKTL